MHIDILTIINCHQLLRIYYLILNMNFYYRFINLWHGDILIYMIKIFIIMETHTTIIIY